MSVLDTLFNAATVTLPDIGVGKSLRDMSTAGQLIDNNSGTVGVIRSSDGMGEGRHLFKKQHVSSLRQYAEFSPTVRTALDVHRNVASLAKLDVVPSNSQKSMDKGVERELIDLLDLRMTSGDEYSDVKEQQLEDYFVIGHGVSELWLKRKGVPYNITPLDAAQIGFVQNWDGSDPAQPRYAELDNQRRVKRWLGDQHVMLMMNRKRSYDRLGLSHVEALDMAVRALLAGDDNLLAELQYPAPSGALNLGEGVDKAKAESVRSYIQSAKQWAFVVLSGASKAEFIPFKQRDIKYMDKQIWFVREVAGIFGLPMAIFGHAVDQNRANMEALLDQASEGLINTLQMIRRVENGNITKKFGPIAKHNCMLDYPLLNRKDEMKQAGISAIQLAQQAFVSENEARQDAGKDPLPFQIANEVLVDTPDGPVPLSVLEEEYFAPGAKEARAEARKAGLEAAKRLAENGGEPPEDEGNNGGGEEGAGAGGGKEGNKAKTEASKRMRELRTKAAAGGYTITAADRKAARDFWRKSQTSKTPKGAFTAQVK